jgi:hypothetical protein
VRQQGRQVHESDKIVDGRTGAGALGLHVLVSMARLVQRFSSTALSALSKPWKSETSAT